MSATSSQSTATRWFAVSVVTLVVQILVAGAAALVALPGVTPAYDETIVRHGVFGLVIVPALDPLRQLASSRAHRDARWQSSTSPLRAQRLLIAVGTAGATAIAGVFVPWLVIPVFVTMGIAIWLTARA